MFLEARFDRIAYGMSDNAWSINGSMAAVQRAQLPAAKFSPVSPVGGLWRLSALD